MFGTACRMIIDRDKMAVRLSDQAWSDPGAWKPNIDPDDDFNRQVGSYGTLSSEGQVQPG